MDGKTLYSGNGAYEALERWFAEAADFGHTVGTGPTQLLAWLWVEGFKVVPLTQEDVKPPPR